MYIRGCALDKGIRSSCLQGRRTYVTQSLEEYSRFVAVSRKYLAEGLEGQEAYEAAISYCIAHDILRNVLNEKRSEVLGMLLEEFDQEKYERTLREEGREEGIEAGQIRINKLNVILLSQKRYKDLERAATDRAFQNKLLQEMGI